MTYKTAKIGTYYNGHDSKLIDNSLKKDLKNKFVLLKSIMYLYFNLKTKQL
jgi:hypothetical protein